MKKDKLQLLKILVGSRAHGLHTDASDHDYRGVYVASTEEILSLGYKYKGTHWVEGENEDQSAYELGHFLNLACKSNPSILEVMVGPVAESYKEGVHIDHTTDEVLGQEDLGQELRDLFPYVWTVEGAYSAFTGYSSNQRKKMIDKKDNRQWKFAVAYIRTLWNLEKLLDTGTFTLEITDPDARQQLIDIRNGKYTVGGVLDLAEEITGFCKMAKEHCSQEQDLTKVHDFLMKVRKRFWTLPNE
jgi:predicted nucleotidyltransferase